MWARLRSSLGALLKRHRFEERMDQEMQFHLEAFTEDLVESGVPRREAERRARVEFGGSKLRRTRVGNQEASTSLTRCGRILFMLGEYFGGSPASP
jgi:hypothetical protein